MKVKSVQRTANCCWSPEEVTCGIYVAAGTTAQQVDATFSTNSSLEILSLDVTCGDKELKPVASLNCDQRFHKLVWGPLGIQAQTAPSGVICGGTDNGSIQVFDVHKMMSKENALISTYTNHSGPVHALDFNSFQHNLLASGSRESEVFIWDLSSPAAQPYAPGAVSHPLEEVVSLAWNRQVQHILASALPSRCVIWDLRKSEPIIRVADTSSRFRCKAVAWNPTVATQLCLASDDDHAPWLQVWDLRYASSPVKTLEGHQKGILSLNWNPKDPDMLITCGKDSSVCIWNPNGDPGSELISEIKSTNEWNFEAGWCPRNPALIYTASFSGEVSVYSVFGGEDGGQGDSLKKAPSWLAGGVGAKFAFGGKLVSFSKESSQVDVAQVVTDDELVSRVKLMEDTFFKRAETDFWQKKEAECGDVVDKMLWQMVKVAQEVNCNRKMQRLLGFVEDEIHNGIEEEIPTSFDSQMNLNNMCNGDSSCYSGITKVLISGDVRHAAEMCLKNKKFCEALLLADYCQDAKLKENIRREYLTSNSSNAMSRLIAGLTSGLWKEFVELSPTSEWKATLATILGHVVDGRKSSFLCTELGNKLKEKNSVDSAMLCYVAAKDITKVIECYTTLHGKPDGNIMLQMLMELVTAMKVSMGVQQLPTDLSSYVADYVTLLSEQGCLATSIHYLNDLNAKDPKTVQLRDRIVQSQAPTNSPVNKQSSPQHPSNSAIMHNRNRTLSTTSSIEGSLYGQTQRNVNPVAPQAYQPMMPSMAQHAPMYPQMTPSSPYDTNSNYYPPAPQPESMVSPQGARPPSRTAGRSKYVVDPSIQNATGYGNYGAAYPAPVQPSSDVNYGYQQSTMGQYNPYTDNRSDTPGFNNAFTGAPTAGFNPGQVSQAITSQPGHHQPAPTNLPTTTDYTADERYSAPGWNDPPAVRRSSKPRIQSESLMEELPPLMSPLPNVQPAFPENQYFNPQQNVPGTGLNMHSQQPQQQYQAAFPVSPQKPPTPVEKGPIPSEFEQMYNTYERLRQECLGVQNNLVHKKIEDVSKRLENLADKLRLHALSDTTIQNLSMISESVSRHDYNHALQVFGYVAQTSSMSETSSFLPGIKTLLNVAAQHQVFI